MAVASFFAELKRRRVIRAAAVYAGVAFVLIQAADIVFPALRLPEWTLTFVVAVAVLGFPMTLALAWVFDVTPQGVTRTRPPVAAAEPTTAADVHEASVAVLPFINISPDPENEYFSDGLTEELLNMLAQVEGLRVPARTSSFAFKGKNTDIRRIGERLRVRTVLEGSVRKAGERVMITAQLINVADGYHLWSGTYKRELKDIFTIQEEIARAIVGTLRVRLLGTPAAPTSQRTGDSAAYTLYLKGRFFANRRSEEGFRKAIECFEEAVARDPGYALAYAGLADAYALLSDYNLLPPKEGMPRAKEAALKALALDDSLAEAHTSLAMIRHDYDWDYAGSERDYLRALDLNPAYATAYHWYGEFLVLTGRFAKGVAQLERAQQLDPLSLSISADRGAAFYYARQPDRAAEQLQRTLELDANFAPAHQLLGLAYAQKGMLAEARLQLERALEIAPGTVRSMAALAHVHAALGAVGEAQRIVTELKRIAGESYVSPYDLAIVLASIGDQDGAFAALQRAVDERIFQAVHVKVDPLLDGLRADPRFDQLLEQVGLN